MAPPRMGRAHVRVLAKEFPLKSGTFLVPAAAAGLIAAAAIAVGLTSAGADSSGPPTLTPIKHVVVLYQENISFDHYFGTYPHATNPAGETPFTALAGHADGQRAVHDAAHQQPQRRQPAADRPAVATATSSAATTTTTTRPSRRHSTAA